MIRYIKINLRLFRNSLIRDSQMPGHIVASVLFRVIDIVISLVFFNIIFNNVHELAGWSYWQVIFLYAFARSIITFHSAWTKRGIQTMSSGLIRHGEFDFYLAKPVDPMIMVSIRQPRIYNFITLLFMIPLAIYAAAKTGLPIGPENIFWFLILAFFGFILYYFLSVLVIIPTFWFIRLWTIGQIMDRLGTFMRYPAGIFSQIVKIALMVFFPVITISYIPAKMLFEAPEPKYIIFMILITLFFGIITRWFWRLGEKSYSSASS
jgi:ABC-2 type transport system permease protein